MAGAYGASGSLFPLLLLHYGPIGRLITKAASPFESGLNTLGAT